MDENTLAKMLEDYLLMEMLCEIDGTASFEDARVNTDDTGFCVRVGEAEFQITVVQTKS